MATRSHTGLVLSALQLCCFLCADAASAGVAQAKAARELSLWPMPAATKLLATECLAVSNDTFKFQTTSRSKILQDALTRYKHLAFLHGGTAQPCDSKLDTPASAPLASLAELSILIESEDETLGPSTLENYTLTVIAPTGTLVASSVFGALRGLETFAQLQFDSAGERLLPSVSVQDTPRFGYRAIMVDTARLFRPISLLKQMLDAMASAKLNALYLHLTDDNCWPLEIESYPLLTSNCSTGCNLDGHSTTGGQYYSQVDIRDLVSYARARGIRVIPEIDSPGHFNTERCYPNLLTTANYPCPGAGPGKGSFRSTPDPSNPKLWSFFKGVFGEMATLFPDPYVSLGGDEAWLTPWTCSPSVKQWMAAKNLTSLGAAAHYYEEQLFSIVDSGTGQKQTMMWAPGEAVVSNSTIHIVWSGWPQNGSPDGWKNDFASFTAKGQPVVLSGPWYLTPSHPEWDEWENWYHTDPGNFSGGAEKGVQPLLLGGMGTIWSDLVKQQIVTQAWPLMNAVAEQLWSPQSVTALPGAPSARYKAQCARLQQRGILNATGCNPPPPPPPPPPAPPPPAPVKCSPHSSVKLNNTKYVDGNGPRTTADAAACCQLCAKTGGCNHWSFQIDPSVKGNICHWGTLTYCCWMHASGEDAVAAPNWTSDLPASGREGSGPQR